MARTKSIDPALVAALAQALGIQHVGPGPAVSKATVARPVTRPAASPADYTVTRSEYKGHPTVTFTQEGRRPISLGFGKVRLILAHADKLKALMGGGDASGF